ncbi:MAG TPA: phosphotransferase, partial [Galbitalea sp.]
GATPKLERIGGWSTEGRHCLLNTHYLLDRQPSGATLYQVPLSQRETPLPAGDPISVTPITPERDLYVYDATHDPDYAIALLDLIEHEEQRDETRGHRQPGTQEVTVTTSAILRGEQSNTSIICSTADGHPIIIKVFRALHHGENPDVVLQSALASTGCDLVPASVGFVSGRWRDAGQPDAFATGHLAFAQEFLVGAEDAWRIAVRAAQAGEDFTGAAHELGAATAHVHQTLLEVMPAREMSADDMERMIGQMHARARVALGEVPALEPRRTAILAAIDGARDAQWPRLQRIHGDYHLGQVLSAGGGRWVLVDFEGEPLRPMIERSEPDVAIRDVAGMLRSIDYAAGSITDHDRSEWAAAARAAFLAGYVEASGRDLSGYRGLLDVFELDKALYEAVYEARNRPDWIGIPVSAIERLTSA